MKACAHHAFAINGVHRDRPSGVAVRESFASEAFTLVELLVVMVVVSLLTALLLPVLSRARDSARSAQCLSQMRQISLAARLYADANGDQFPRSQHSAFANRQLPWERTLAPLLGQGGDNTAWTNLLRGIYHCGADKDLDPLSYGINVFFELGPDDEYQGKPQTWRRLAQIPGPAETVFYGETGTAADHFMAQFWLTLADARGEVDTSRHRRKSNYTFVDGHGERLPIEQTFHPPALDQWNPGR